MHVSTRRFGEIDIPRDKIISMAKPILGFESLSGFCLIEAEEMAPFMWLQAIEDPNVAFIVVNPRVFFPDYRIEVNRNELAELKIAKVEDVETFVVATVPADPKRISVNLQGPVIINTATNLAKQLVMVNSHYQVKHYLMEIPDLQEDRTATQEREAVGV